MGPEEGYFRQGAVRRCLVAVHCIRDDHNTLDTLCREVITALDGARVPCYTGTGSKYILPVYLGSTADAFDPDRETIFKIVEFEIYVR